MLFFPISPLQHYQLQNQSIQVGVVKLISPPDVVCPALYKCAGLFCLVLSKGLGVGKNFLIWYASRYTGHDAIMSRYVVIWCILRCIAIFRLVHCWMEKHCWNASYCIWSGKSELEMFWYHFFHVNNNPDTQTCESVDTEYRSNTSRYKTMSHTFLLTFQCKILLNADILPALSAIYNSHC